MDLSDQEIKEKISNKEMLAITVDTSVFDGNGNRLERGLLAQLGQFKGTDISLLLSDVVVREVRAHIARDAAAAQSKIVAALKEVGAAWQATDAQRESAKQVLFGKTSPEQLAEQRLKDFLESTSAQVVDSAKRVDVARILDYYFNSKPPFGKSESKKSEFPDAFALEALNAWANEEGTLVLVVSKDGDWKKYCKESPRLVACDDLAKALGFFQQNADVACLRLTQRFNSQALNITEDIKAAVERAAEQWIFVPEVSAAYYCEGEVFETAVKSISIEVPHGSSGPFQVVDKQDEDMLVVEANIEAIFDVSASFRFTTTDPIDKDEVPMGSASATVELPLDLRVLLTFEGDLAGDAELTDVEVEIEVRYIEVDYGEVGPDWEPDPDEY